MSCLLSCFLGFSANSFLRFHFVFQKAVLFRTLGNYNIIYAITSGGNYLLIIIIIVMN
jgi:hypothetical protein